MPAHRARVLGLEPLQNASLPVEPVCTRKLVTRLADRDVRQTDAARRGLSVLCLDGSVESVEGYVRSSVWVHGVGLGLHVGIG